MNKTIYTLAISSIAAAFLVGCGSSSSSDDTQLNGYFIDSAVANVDYNTSSGITGTTDENGRFEYKKGDKVTFAIGKLVLGECEPQIDGLVTPATLADNNETTTLILQVLQSLDADNNVSNGIEIPTDVIDALEENLTDVVEIAEITDSSELLNLNETLEQKLDEDGDGEIDVNVTEAQYHFSESMQNWEREHAQYQQNTQGPKGNGKGPQDGSGQGEPKGPKYGSSQNQDNGSSQDGNNSFDLTAYPVTASLPQDLKDAIAYMGNEERLAYDVYENLYDFHKENNNIYIMQLDNIASKSEKTHIATVRALVERYNLGAGDVTNIDQEEVGDPTTDIDSVRGEYDISKIQDLYDALYAKGVDSQQAALEVGCMVEVTDVNDLDEYIAMAEEANATDVLAAFEFLRNGSYNHYWAFDKGLKNLGVTEGCAVLGEEYAKTPEEYPQSNQSNH